ncbi:hypothetical protein N9095_00090 [bacterium]|nr:hypothetical protein [bacterium]
MIPLVITSGLFMLPAIKGFKKKKKFMAVVNGCTSLVSMNYWRNPVKGIRQNMDFTLAKTNFMLHFLQAKSEHTPLAMFIGTCWLKSTEGGKHWTVWHALFHTGVISGMYAISA